MANLTDINYGIGKYLELSDASDVPAIGTNRTNVDLLNFKVATNNAYALYNFKDGMIDAYVSEAGIDTGTSTYEVYDASGNYYSPLQVAESTTAFTSTGSSSWTAPANVTEASVLVVAGGGQGGGGFHGGGGGAGGLVYVAAYGVTAGVSISLSVGAGGTGTTGGSVGVGGNSTFGILTANGGGTGGNSQGVNGYTGGSGGGGGTNSNGPGAAGAASNQPVSFSPYSNVGFGTSGGTGKSGSGSGDTLQAAGGGGAGGAGGNHSTGPGSGPRGGPGGIGKDYSSVYGTGYGASGWFGGGGGGGSYVGYNAGAGGQGGGGNGHATGNGNPGSANTGGGGGGCGSSGNNSTTARVGGTGVVLVKVAAADYNMTLVSNAQTAATEPDEGRLMLYEEDVDSVTLNTDLKGYVSRDGGSTYTAVTLAEDTVYGQFGIDSYNKLLLHMNGSNDGTTFTDSSISGHTVTAVGNAHTDTAIKKFGTASYQGDGTGDYLTIPASDDWDFGTGDFTVDTWVYASSANTYGFGQYSGGGAYAINQGGGTEVNWYRDGGSALNFGSGSSPTANTWTHVAIVRSSAVTTYYKDGVVTGSAQADTFDYDGSGDIYYVGSVNANAGHSPLVGYIDEFRVSKGIARWTAAFTPPIHAYGANQRLLSGSVDISGQPSGTSMKYKVETLNDKDLKLHGASMLWV